MFLLFVLVLLTLINLATSVVDHFNRSLLSSSWSIYASASGSEKWSARYNHSSVVLNDMIYVLGGFDHTISLNDVWSTSDGATWTEVTGGLLGRVLLVWCLTVRYM